MGISKRILLGIGGGLALVAAGVVVWQPWRPSTDAVGAFKEPSKLVINEAARTLLYLPLYHAERMGYFKDEGLEVKIVTGGSAATAVAAVISGDANIAQADPMYAPISQAKGSDVVVIGQIVGRIGLWALARPGTNLPFDAVGLKDTPIITHPKPMSSFTYTELLLQQFGISEEDAKFVEAKPGTEVATFNAEVRVPFIVTVEPAVSILQDQGAKIVYSWPKAVGDRVFSGLMVRKAAIASNPDLYRRALRAYQRALDDIAARRPSVAETAKAYFPNLESDELGNALERLTGESVFPRSLRIDEASWRSAVEARKKAGDLATAAAFSDNVQDGFIAEALRQN
jgi:NitT/TauT family transport system substrate-binding protein